MFGAVSDFIHRFEKTSYTYYMVFDTLSSERVLKALPTKHVYKVRVDFADLGFQVPVSPRKRFRNDSKESKTRFLGLGKRSVSQKGR